MNQEKSNRWGAGAPVLRSRLNSFKQAKNRRRGEGCEGVHGMKGKKPNGFCRLRSTTKLKRSLQSKDPSSLCGGADPALGAKKTRHVGDLNWMFRYAARFLQNGGGGVAHHLVENGKGDSAISRV